MTTPSAPQEIPITGSQESGADQVTQLVAAHIKRNWDSHYRAAWGKLGSPTGLRAGTSSNWSAAFFPVYWLAYRRRFGLALGMFALSMVLMGLWAESGNRVGLVLWIVVPLLLMGAVGDRIVLERAWRAADKAVRQFGSGEQATGQASASGGVSRTGPACFVMLPPVLVVGLALLYQPHADTKQRAYPTQMKSDLISLSTAESTYYADSGRYMTDVRDRFTSTSGVNAPTIVVSGKAYSATITHSQLPGMICGIAVGMPNPVKAAGEGEPVCKRLE